MNRISTDKIRSATPFLIRFRRCLPHPIQSFVRPYLDQPYQLALQVLDCCSSTQPLSMGDVANQIGVTRETVRQVLLALKEGGMPFATCSRQGWQLLGSEQTTADLALDCAFVTDRVSAAPAASDYSDYSVVSQAASRY